MTALAGPDADQLVAEWLWLADAKAGVFAAQGFDPDDARSDAYLGLLLAARRWDPARGVTFRTYAARTIEGTIRDHRRRRTWRRQCSDRGRILVSLDELAALELDD